MNQQKRFFEPFVSFLQFSLAFDFELFAKCSLHLVSRSFIRSFSSTQALQKSIKHVTIIGSGLMGSGIAQVSAQSQLNVTLVDQNEQILQKAQQAIEKSVKRVAKKKFPEDEASSVGFRPAAQKSFAGDTLNNIRLTPNVSKAVKNADLVIEAIVENIGVKQKLFSEIESAAPQDAILATNTSSLRLKDIGEHLKRKDQFVGLHFFNPVPVMKLLEVVRHDQTSDAVFNDAVAYGKSVGKVTVACKDTPGFIVNRLLVPYMYEALKLAEREDATFKDIDVAMKLGAGYPMGPFELADYVGLDTLKFIQDGWRKQDPNNELFKPSKLLDKLVSEKKFGVKTGEGFYKYSK
ncbi:putative 3-hydroxyacyl-CoA dehydrogenase [Aphelenchoides bicaudatus]|nr:putative 3-hydroxyacyl-CoA dehydrogenase [Aphelenchoides bicaudatus]